MRTASAPKSRKEVPLDGAIAALQHSVEAIEMPKGSFLFQEGEEATGVYLLCSGRVRLNILGNGGVRTLRIAKPGALLALGSVFTGKPLPVTAEVLSRSKVTFLPKETFFQKFWEDAEVRLPILRALSEEVGACWDVIRARGKAA